MNPVLFGIVVIGVVFLIGTIAERWSWSKPIAVLGFIALILESTNFPIPFSIILEVVCTSNAS